MQSIIITLSPAKMTNPDLDIRYILPQRIEEYSNGVIQDNGYDYISETELGIWLAAEQAEEAAATILDLLKSERILENDLTVCSQIYISTEENAELNSSRMVYPSEYNR